MDAATWIGIFFDIVWRLTRSHPPPHAGCPRGDPGPLPVLTRMLLVY